MVMLLGGRMLAVFFEQKTIHKTAPQDFFIKNQGLVFQRAALRAGDILLLYGSSELTDPVVNRASDFFSKEPTGFQVCPVGRAGTTSLIILQKVGALGADLRGRKVAISLSPSFFLTPALSPYTYAGNFSLTAASGLLFGNALSWDLKAQIARRMLEFPNTLAKDALLQLAANCLASGRAHDRIVFKVIWPLGKLQNAILDLQDHFEALVFILSGGKSSLRHGRVFTARKTTRSEPPIASQRADSRHPAQDEAFRARIAAASEWKDLELLFRTLREIKAQPLILSIPIDAALYEVRGVSPSARRIYYDRLRDLASQYHFPVVDFREHDADPSFLIAHREHPTPKGWMYYNRALDDFFHKSK
jgi:D-alanine transfer protein